MPANRMSRFDVFIGTWNTTGDVLATHANPAGRLVATDTYRWLPGRQFVVHDVDARFDGTPARSMEVIGFDSARKRYVATSFDDQGTSDTYVVALDGRRWTVTGTTVRFDGAFDAQRNRLTGLWELKGPRVGWQPWIRLALARA